MRTGETQIRNTRDTRTRLHAMAVDPVSELERLRVANLQLQEQIRVLTRANERLKDVSDARSTMVEKLQEDLEKSTQHEKMATDKLHAAIHFIHAMTTPWP